MIKQKPPTPETNQTLNGQIDERFTALRGFAAMTVVMSHYQGAGFLSFAPLFKYSGQFGLFLFFFLSAFLLAHSLVQKEWLTTPVRALMAYAINRMCRILPLFLVVVIASWWLHIHYFPTPVPFVTAVIGSLTLGMAPSVLWTIPVELTFYCYLPLVLALFTLASRHKIGALLIVLAFAGWTVAIAVAAHADLLTPRWMTLGFHWYANSFVGGVLFYVIVKRGAIPSTAGARLGTDLIAAPFILAYPFFVSTLLFADPSVASIGTQISWQAFYNYVFPWAPFLTAGVFLSLIYGHNTILSRIMTLRPLVALGQISFGVYLLHMPALELSRAFMPHGNTLFVVALLGTLLTALFASWTVEQPAIKLGHAIGRMIGRLSAKKNQLWQAPAP